MTSNRTDASVEYALPRRARQGPHTWYVIHLHFSIALTEQGTGDVYVETLHNGFASSQVRFRVSANGGMTESSVSLIGGSVHREYHTRSAVVRYQNYLQYRGVQPGRNLLKFQIERDGHVGVRDVTIFRDSGIEVTNRGPARLVVKMQRPAHPWRINRRAALYVTVRNDGGREVRDVRLALEYDADAFRVQRGAGRKVLTLSPHQARKIRWDVVPRRKGRLIIGLSASSSANHPGDSIYVDVR